MHSTYHFKSAADINMDVLEAIKTAYKEKPVVLTIEEEEDAIGNEAQQQFVYRSISKYQEHAEMLISEEDAWVMINEGE